MVTGYVVLKWLHVLAAAYLVGAIVTEGLLGGFAARAKDRAARRFAWEFLVKGEEKVAIPVALLLLVSGLLMVFGPFAGGWSLTEDLWTLAGLVLFLVLLVLMAGVAGSAAKRALAAYTTGAGEGEAAPHEKRYQLLLATGFVIVAGVVWLMVAKPI